MVENIADETMAGEHAPTVAALAEMVSYLTTEEWKLLRASLEEVLARIQEDRGGSYSRAVYWRKLDEAEALGRKIIQGEIARAVSLVAGALKPPEEPTEALRNHQKRSTITRTSWRKGGSLPMNKYHLSHLS